MEYPKIQTIFDRNKDTFKVNGVLRELEFGLIHQWLVTEKIDGTNIRVFLDAGGAYDEVEPRVRFGGRTDNAQLPPKLLSFLEETFTVDKMVSQFQTEADIPNVILFGEGYGEKIQKGGGNYREGVSFRLFDVLVYDHHGKGWWLNWENVEGVAHGLGIQTVPVVGTMHIERAVGEVFSGMSSLVADAEKGAAHDAEGIVARTDPLLFDRRGNRVMWKLKTSDFA